MAAERKSVRRVNGDYFLALSSAKRSPYQARQRGASLVEYAFVFIAFISMIFGISGFGHMLFIYHHVNNAAKEATRYASVRGSTCGNDANGGSCQTSNSASGISGPTTAADVQAFVNTISPPSIDRSRLVVPTSDGTYFCGVSDGPACSPAIATAPTSCKTAGAGTANQPFCTVKVTVAYSYQFIFPLLPVSSTTTAPCTTPGFCLASTSEMVIVH